MPIIGGYNTHGVRLWNRRECLGKVQGGTHRLDKRGSTKQPLLPPSEPPSETDMLLNASSTLARRSGRESSDLDI